MQFSTYGNNTFIDYDYLLNNNLETFPNRINPRYFKVNDNIVFLLNDLNSLTNLYINNNLASSWIRGNFFSGYIRIFENDLANLLVYAIYDKEICILDLSSN